LKEVLVSKELKSESVLSTIGKKLVSLVGKGYEQPVTLNELISAVEYLDIEVLKVPIARTYVISKSSVQQHKNHQ
jgi:hypothetical protein